MAIDILLATYNGEKYLQQQLDSLFSQTYKNFHLYIRDDGSTDGTLAIIEKAKMIYPITLIEDGQHLGVIKSFGALLSHSKSPYAMFCDHDDVWLPHKIEASFKKMQAMEKTFGKGSALLVHSDLQVVDANLKIISPSFWSYAKLYPKEGSRLNRLLIQNEVTGCTVLMNRPLIDLSNPLFSGCMMHDWWVALIASAFGHIGVITEPLILYRQHGKNTLGAVKFCFRKKGKTPPQNHDQAKALLERFDLDQAQSKMIEDYLSIKGSSFLRKRWICIRHQFFRHGFLRNVYGFFMG